MRMRIITWNLNLLPWIIGDLWSMGRKKRKRLETICDYLFGNRDRDRNGEKNCCLSPGMDNQCCSKNVDVICLQEVFGVDKAQYICDRAKKDGGFPYSSYYHPKETTGYSDDYDDDDEYGPLSRSSSSPTVCLDWKEITRSCLMPFATCEMKISSHGLLILSKYPIEPGSERCIYYHDSASFDAFVKKAILSVRIHQIPSVNSVRIFNTHLQSSDGDPNVYVRARNLDQLVKELNYFSHEVCILAGDLNLDLYSEKENTLLFSRFYSLESITKQITTTTNLPSSPRHCPIIPYSFPSDRLWLDYILPPKYSSVLEHRLLIPEEDNPLWVNLSDHLPVVMKCNLF